MYGWRGRIGLLVPSTNFAVEQEFYRAVPERVSIHTARCVIRDNVETDEEKMQATIDMGKDVVKAAREVSDIRPKVISFACTSGSFLKGIGHDRELIQEVEKEIGIKTLTTSTAVVNALKELDVKKVAVATPYIRAVDEKEKIFKNTCLSRRC